MSSGTPFVFAKPKFQPITYLDDGQSKGNTKDPKLKIQIPNRGKVIQSHFGLKKVEKKINHRLPQSIFLVSILEHLCGVYEQDGKKANSIFLAICEKLEEVDIISPLSFMEEYASVRHQYKASFYNLIQSASALNLDSRLQLKYGNHPNNIKPSKFNLITSRFKEEFVEFERLGKGAYGIVCKAKHKMDGQFYAMKKIRIKKASDVDKINRMIREVQSLAALQQHANIVRYHQAWMEQEFSHLAKQQKGNESQFQSGDAEKNNFELPDYTSYNNSNSVGSSNDNFSLNSFEDAPYTNSNKNGKFWRSNSSPSLSHLSSFSNTRNGFDCISNKRSNFYIGSNNTESSHSSLQDNSRVEKYKKSQNCCFVLYIQMELCEKTLASWLQTRNQQLSAQESDSKTEIKVDVDVALCIFKQIVAALDHLHTENIFHRDVKPSNIFVCGEKEPHVLLGDFGLARAMNNKYEPLTPLGDLSANFDEHTTGVGTTVYAAPEQLVGQDYCYKADMFSIGIVLYELLWPLYTSHERDHVIKSLRNEIIPTKFMDTFPKIGKLISTLISHDPDKRPSASELLQNPLFLSENEKIIFERDAEISLLKTENNELRTKNLELQKLVEFYKLKANLTT